MVDIFIEGIIQTIYMVGISLVLAYCIGLPIAIILVITAKDGVRPNLFVNRILGYVVNISRSLPFIILLLLVVPFTRLIVGTSIGPTAMIPPLTLAAAPFVARLTESSLKEIDRKVIEMLQVMGASTKRIIIVGYLGEAIPSLIRGISITAIALVGYCAMAGFVGGGGLGTIAISYGYHSYNYKVMLAAVAVLIVLVQIIQSTFDYISKKINKI